MNRIFDMACRRTLLTCAALSLSFGVAQPGWAGGSGGNGATSATGGHGGAGSDGTATNLHGASGGMNGDVSGISGTGIGGGGPGQDGDSVTYVAGGGGGGGNAVSAPHDPGSGGTGQGYGGEDRLPGGDGGELGAVIVSSGTVSVALNGQAGSDSIDVFSGVTAGGGGGGDGAIYAASGSLTVNAAITGGNGGSANIGNRAALGGGGGGGGGAGLVVTSNGMDIIVADVIRGGNGGDGGDSTSGVAGGGGGGGGGGVGMAAASETNIVVESGGAIKGGSGGAGGAGDEDVWRSIGHAGEGGVGVLGQDLDVIVAGTISGGMDGYGVNRANAITFTGGENRLLLQAGATIEGSVSALAGTNDSLVLGGDDTPATSFDVSKITGFPTPDGVNEYIGFEHFEKTGASAWTLKNTTRAKTSWTISQGTLVVSNDGNLGDVSGDLTLDGGTLRVTGLDFTDTARNIVLDDHGGAFDIAHEANVFTMSKAITGTGGLTKTGAGTLVLNGENTYAGGTVVSAGTLEVGDKDHAAASIQGNVTVSAQGTLRGHGTIGDAASLITNNAIVRPGGSIGDLNIPGSYMQSSSGMLMIDVGPTAASHLIVGGTATLNGTLKIVYGPGTYSPRTYPGIVSAGGGITDNTTKTSKGKPAGLTQTVALNGPNALDLTLAFTGTTVIAPTNATIFGTAGAAALRDSQRVNGLLLDRLGDACGECAGQRLWARATGTDTHIDGNNDAPDARDKRYGFLAGFDRHLDNGATAGLAVGYSHADVTEDTGDAKAKLDTLRLAAYAGKRLGPVNVAGTLGYAYDFISTTRSFGSLGKAEDSGHGQLFTAAAQAGLPWALGRATFTTSLGLRYAHLDGFGLSESGPTSQNLDVDAQHTDSLQPFAAVTLDYPLNLTADKPAHLKVRLGYAYETLDASHDVSLASIDGTRFVIPGTSDSRGMLSAGLGLDLPVSKTANAYIRYDTVFHTGNVSAQSVQAGFSYRF